MRAFALFLTLTALFASAGCFTTGAKDVTPPPPAAMLNLPPPVTAEQLTPQNYRSKMQELVEEMDREEQQTTFVAVKR